MAALVFEMGVKEIAEERIRKLFLLAEKNSKYADRYLEIALKIQQKARVKLTGEQKKLFCKKCKKFLGKNLKCECGNNLKRN